MNNSWDMWREAESSSGFCAVMENPGLVLKSIAWLVIFAFVWHAGLPLAEAAANGTLTSPPVSQSVAAVTDEDEFAETLKEIEAKIAKISLKLGTGEDESVEEEDLKKLEKKIRELSAKLEEKFIDEENELKAKKLPQVILDRQAAMVQMYKTELATLLANIQAIGAATTPAQKKAEADKAKRHLEEKKHHRKSDFDPNNMPNKSEQPDRKRKPKESKGEYAAAGFISSPMAQVAANGAFTFSKLAGASNPAYLAESTEVKLTPAIKALAAALNHHPVAIHNWVRNNVEWLPTWGAMQPSDMTLSTLKGNAMDIASLTIALLRASGIPARYVHGTIDVPRDRFMNWAGGFTSATAAGDHASSGGIPVTSIISGGRIAKYRMEHVWVEAAIDYYPSRGVVNRDADSWIAMDTSFKQYADVAGLDLNAIAPFDAQAFVNQYQASTTIDPVTGSVTGGNPALIQNAITQRQTAVNNYVTANMPNATVRDVIGGRVIQAIQFPHLPASLPYHVKVSGASYASLPPQLQYRVSFQFQSVDPFGLPSGGTPVTLSMPELNNQKVTVSYRPATPADEQTLQSLLPKGQITNINQLPASIPAYLIRVIPELKLNGQVIMTGAAVQMGSDHQVQYTIQYPDGRTRSYASNFEAGTFHSVGIVGGSVAKSAIQTLQDRINTHQQEWVAGNYTDYTREAVQGDVFYAGMLTYFAQYSVLAGMQTEKAGVEHLLQPSIGTFGSSGKISYFFGFPRNMSSAGLIMDVGKLITVTTAKDGDNARRLNFVMSVGFLGSGLEHQVPEMIFSTPTQPVQAVSAVKALTLASAQGIPVYQIDATNAATVLPKLQLGGSVVGEIQAAVSAGKRVTTHQTQVALNGWTGAGYAIVDPVTGDGAYRISGGFNGGALPDNPNIVGLGLMSNILTGLSGYAKIAGSIPSFVIGPLATILGLMLLLMDFWAGCAGADLSFIVGITVIFMSVFLAVAFIGALLGPFAALIMGFATSQLLDFVKNAVTNTSICRRP